MGTMYKRGDIWYVDYYVDGKRVRKPVSKKRSEAKLFLVEVEEKLITGEFGIINTEKTLVAYVQQRKEYFTKTRRSGYAKRCSFIFDHFRRFVEKENIKYIRNFSREHFEKYTQERLNHISPKTVNDELYIIRWIFESAKDHDYIAKNPIEKFKKLKYDPKPQRYFSGEELKVIYRESPTPFRNVYKFLTNSGLRIGELEHLEWTDINKQHKIVSISYKDNWVPKNSQQRDIPANKTLWDLIEELEEQASNLEGYIFPIQGRQPKEHLLENLQRICIEYGFKHATIHSFRHTFGTHLAQKGVGIYEIKQLMGHSDIRMTLRYARLAPKNLEDAVRTLDNS